MSKHVNPGLADRQKIAATHWISGMPKASLSASVRSSSQSVPTMKELISSQPHCPGELERLQEYPVKLMQHQQAPANLGQQINEIILNSYEEETLLDQIAQTLGEAFRVDCCLIIVRLDSSTDQIGYWHSNNNSGLPPQQQMLVRSACRSSMMQAGSEPLVIDDVEAHEISPLIEWRHLGLAVRAVLQIPTKFQGKINGAIALYRAQPYHWSESEKESALASAAPVAIAISQILKTRSIASLQQQLHTSRQYQSLIERLTMASRAPLELNQILQLASTGTATALQVDRGLILTLKYADPLFKTRSRKKIPKAKATVVCEWHSGNDSDVLERSSPDTLSHDRPSTVLNESFWISDSWLWQQAFINSPSPLVIADQNDLPANALATDIAPLFNFARLPAVLMLPLESGNTVLGFLVLQHSQPRLWNSEELALLELVSAQVSTAMIQSQTLRQVQSLVEDRTAQLQRSLEVQAKLYEKTRQQIDQLRQLNSLKDEFVSTMSHELRTPLTSMSLAIRMLRQPGLPTERQAKYLDILDQQCSQEINLVNDLLKLQELESHKASLNLETIDLKSKIDDLAQSFKEKWADKGLTITFDLPKTSLLVETDSESFERILQELLTNAGKYSDPDTTVVLRASHGGNQQDNQIVLTVTNLGPGISPEDATYIFDKFRRGQGVTQQAIQGTGLGLALVKCLVQHLNGSIAVSSSPTEASSSWETCFTLTLPQFFDSPQP